MEKESKYKGLFYNGDENLIADTKIDSDTNTINKETSKNRKRVSYTLVNGDKYEGMEENKKRNGLGTYTFQNGDKYVGIFKDNLWHGHGVYTNPNGDKYEGQWQNNKKHGFGTYTWSDGEKYEGEFIDDKRSGKGTFISKDYKYEGEWQNDIQNGYGTCTWVSGARYEGDHKNQKQHGHGTYTYPNGDQYVGHWENNQKHGFGFYIWCDGNKSEGEWKYDFMIDAPGSFGYQYTNIITKKKNDPPLPNQNNFIFYIEPIKIATQFGQFSSLSQKLFSLKKSDYDDFVIFFFDFSVRANAILKTLADEAHKEKNTNKDADKLSKMKADIFNRCAIQIFHLGRTVVIENKQVFIKNSYKLYDKYHLEYKNRDGVIEKTLNPIEIVYEEWEKAYTSTSRVTRAYSQEDLTKQSSILKKEVVQNLIKKDKDTVSPGVLLIIDYLEGKVSKQGYIWEDFVDLFLKKYWDKMYKNKAN